jgi:hypothetical protein
VLITYEETEDGLEPGTYQVFRDNASELEYLAEDVAEMEYLRSLNLGLDFVYSVYDWPSVFTELPTDLVLAVADGEWYDDGEEVEA